MFCESKNKDGKLHDFYIFPADVVNAASMIWKFFNQSKKKCLQIHAFLVLLTTNCSKCRINSQICRKMSIPKIRGSRIPLPHSAPDEQRTDGRDSGIFRGFSYTELRNSREANYSRTLFYTSPSHPPLDLSLLFPSLFRSRFLKMCIFCWVGFITVVVDLLYLKLRRIKI